MIPLWTNSCRFPYRMQQRLHPHDPENSPNPDQGCWPGPWWGVGDVERLVHYRVRGSRILALFGQGCQLVETGDRQGASG